MKAPGAIRSRSMPAPGASIRCIGTSGPADHLGVSLCRHAGDPEGSATWSSRFPPPPGSRSGEAAASRACSGRTRRSTRACAAWSTRPSRRASSAASSRAWWRSPTSCSTRARSAREVDFVGALTYPLPVIVIAEIIGVPPADREQFKQWSDEAVENLGNALFMPPPPERLQRLGNADRRDGRATSRRWPTSDGGSRAKICSPAWCRPRWRGRS